jgi:hypothetical protein
MRLLSVHVFLIPLPGLHESMGTQRIVHKLVNEIGP